MSFVTLLLGRPEPTNRGMPKDPYPLTNPFWHERDRWRRDPFYRDGLLRAPFTSQFREDPLGTTSRFLQSCLFGR